MFFVPPDSKARLAQPPPDGSKCPAVDANPLTPFHPGAHRRFRISGKTDDWPDDPCIELID